MNLAPADVRKEGTGFDLAIAVGILASYGLIPSDALKSAVFLGELGLDGHVCPVPGVLPMTLAAVKGAFEPLCTGCQPGRSRCCDPESV